LEGLPMVEDLFLVFADQSWQFSVDLVQGIPAVENHLSLFEVKLKIAPRAPSAIAAGLV
jgi:hypothetical protein